MFEEKEELRLNYQSAIIIKARKAARAERELAIFFLYLNKSC